MRFYKTTLTVVTLCIFGGITHAQTASAPALTKADAAAIALREQTGSIAEAELDRFEGRLVYDVEVVTENGEEVEFKFLSKAYRFKKEPARARSPGLLRFLQQM